MNEMDLFWFLVLTVIFGLAFFFAPIWVPPLIAFTAVFTFRCIYWLKLYFFP